MDIYRYVVASKRIEAVTQTPESEYSATVTPDGERISVIRVEGDGTQRLWAFSINGTASLFLVNRRRCRWPTCARALRRWRHGTSDALCSASLAVA